LEITIDQRTNLYGVIGYPLGHSLSPAMQNAAISAGNLNAVYLALETRDLKNCMKGVRALGIKGLSVTIPYKTDIMPLLDEVHPLADRIGAVNTVVCNNDRLTGYNTDAVGLLRALEEKTDLPGKRALILGAGGAARAAGFVLKESGIEVTIANRSEDRGRALARALSCSFLPLDHLKSVSHDLLINTTPVGMTPHEDQCPVPDTVLRGGMIVMDIIYNPLETLFLKRARKQGCFTINGLTMFVYQGAEQFRLWTGMEPPIDTMNLAVEKALSLRE